MLMNTMPAVLLSVRVWCWYWLCPRSRADFSSALSLWLLFGHHCLPPNGTWGFHHILFKPYFIQNSLALRQNISC